MANSADPDQLASEDFTVCKDRVYPGSAGQELNECTLTTRKRREIKNISSGFRLLNLSREW